MVLPGLLLLARGLLRGFLQRLARSPLDGDLLGHRVVVLGSQAPLAGDVAANIRRLVIEALLERGEAVRVALQVAPAPLGELVSQALRGLLVRLEAVAELHVQRLPRLSLLRHEARDGGLPRGALHLQRLGPLLGRLRQPRLQLLQLGGLRVHCLQQVRLDRVQPLVQPLAQLIPLLGLEGHELRVGDLDARELRGLLQALLRQL
mmetsp:Transcript_55557/g.163184  ORF Transcript_55557/g.163184 Transcript_55557/m.163184 type:complete len:205 (+) Transcript_55557:655-1269(+)